MDYKLSSHSYFSVAMLTLLESCVAPERLSFASLKKEYLNMNFFPVGTIVEYECRPGFRKQPSLSGKSTCLEDLVWSPVAQFCKSEYDLKSNYSHLYLGRYHVWKKIYNVSSEIHELFFY